MSGKNGGEKKNTREIFIPELEKGKHVLEYEKKKKKECERHVVAI